MMAVIINKIITDESIVGKRVKETWIRSEYFRMLNGATTHTICTQSKITVLLKCVMQRKCDYTKKQQKLKQNLDKEF